MAARTVTDKGWQASEPGFESPGDLAFNPESRSEPQVVKPPRAGEICPRCRTERLDYDGLLNLSCPRCGYSLGGCFT